MNHFRLIRFGIQNIVRNGWLSLVTVSMLTLTLLTVNALLVLHVLGATAIRSIEERIEVSVYFRPAISEDIVSSAQGYLLTLEPVRDVRRVTPEDALHRFQEERKNDLAALQALEEVGENPFGYALVVSARTAEDFPFILSALEHPDYAPMIEQKNFQNYEEVISTINRMTRSVRLLGVSLSVLFLLISILIVLNTVRVAIYIYREEIAIMRLVGASSMFIRGPFLFEAFFYSVSATILVGILVFPGVIGIERYADAFFAPSDAGLLAFYLRYTWSIFGLQCLGLLLLSIGSALLAMRKYLKI